ncbi:MAG: apolipoprotein N-acyltransferase [Myxococcales bacterium]|nr:apolipoprotein N-acyltransferase [Myxococcales bacterium]
MASAARTKKKRREDAPTGDPPLIRGRGAEVGALLSGLAYWLAFAGFDIWPLAFVAFVPLWLSLHGQTTRRATWLGWITGMGMNLGGFYWLLDMLKTFSGFPTAICLVFVVIVCAYQAGRLAMMGWLFARAAQRGYPLPLVFAGAFAASEVAFPLLFPWYYAATVHKVPVLMQTADLGGPILVGLVLVAVNLAIAEPIRARLLMLRAPKADPRERTLSAFVDRRVVGVGVLSLLFALVYGAARISSTDKTASAAEAASVGVVQGNMGLMQKRENPAEGLRRHIRLTRELRDKGIDFVVWSESSVTFSVNERMAMETPYFRDRFAGQLGVPAIFGGVLVRPDPDPQRVYRLFNTALSTNARGEITGRYDKTYLLMFGEYLPFGETFPILYSWSPNSGRFSPGDKVDPLVLEVKGKKHNVTALVCYEDILPGFTNRAVAHGNPELLVNITNDAWFGDTAEPWEHLALAKYRAIEHRRYLVRTTNSGVSAVVDPVGRTVFATKTFVADARSATIHWLSAHTVYETLGDGPWYLTALAMSGAAFLRRKKPEGAAAA